METIGFLGSGNMAEALIKGILNATLYKPENILVSDIRQERLDFLAKTYDVKPVEDNKTLALNVDVLILSVKPQNITTTLEGIKNSLRENVLVISIAAGITTANIAAVLGNVAIVRVMPNTPALIGQAASALFANDKAKPMLKEAKAFFSAVGKAVVVETEELLDVVTAVSGSGPAYFFLMMEEMIKAAVELGLPEEMAKKLVFQTAKGAALLAEDADQYGESPAQLRQKVTSPGGTTEAALKVFAGGNFGQLVSKAIRRACERSKELSK